MNAAHKTDEVVATFGGSPVPPAWCWFDPLANPTALCAIPTHKPPFPLRDSVSVPPCSFGPFAWCLTAHLSLLTGPQQHPPSPSGISPWPGRRGLGTCCCRYRCFARSVPSTSRTTHCKRLQSFRRQRTRLPPRARLRKQRQLPTTHFFLTSAGASCHIVASTFMASPRTWGTNATNGDATVVKNSDVIIVCTNE
jgi:hypothetical protein